MPVHWDDLKTVMHLVREGSLANAADTLDVSYTTVARRVKRAEDDLGLRLFERLADGYHATDAGLEVARKATAMETQENDLMRGLAGASQTLSGVLTVTAPQLVCTTLLAPAFEEFIETYPDVDLRVRSSLELLDLNRREADIAIRISNDPGDSLIGRRLLSQKNAVYGVQKWVDQINTDPEALIEWVVLEPFQDLSLEKTATHPNHRARMITDDMMSLVNAACSGMGILRMPTILAERYDCLKPIPQIPQRDIPDMWMVAHRDVWSSARVVAFREILLRHLATLT